MKTAVMALLAFNLGFLAYPIYLLMIRRRLYLVGYYLWMVMGVVCDLFCQLWIDITGAFRLIFKGRLHKEG
jgi:hypothetical protein